VAFKGYLNIAELLIEHRANLDLQHGNGGTALMFAAMFGRNETLKLLLDNGANRHITDVRGQTALAIAAQQGNQEGAAMLLEIITPT
jgi:ankyrin repeat protein